MLPDILQKRTESTFLQAAGASEISFMFNDISLLVLSIFYTFIFIA
jgi:hypothetical protein